MKNNKNLRAGGYSIIAIFVAIILVIVMNVLVALIPASISQIDITDQSMYTVSDQTKQIVSSLDKDVTIYWICTSGYEDKYISHLLDQYKELSDHIKIEEIDPEVYPTFADQYMSDSSDLEDNSIIVECGERFMFMDSADTYDVDYSNYYTDGTYEYYFVGEDAITAGIDYVVNDNLKHMYTLSGHGENDLPTAYTSVIQRDNVAVESLTLVLVGAIPEDCDILAIISPQVDITDAEKIMIDKYLEKGGDLLLVTNPAEDVSTFKNIESIVNYYGVESVPGIVVEPDSYNYVEDSPYKIVPDLIRHEITAPILDRSMYVLMPVSHGIFNTGKHPNGVEVERLLVTSDDAFSKAKGYSMESFSKEEGDIDGPFLLSCAITDTNTDSKIVWISSGYITDYATNTKIAGNNQEFFTNSINWMTGNEASIAMHSKNLSANYLSMTEKTATLLTVVVIVLVPLLYLLIGIVISVRRRRR